MPRSRRRVNPNAQGQRTALRGLGAVLALVGGAFTAVGLIDFFGSMSAHAGPPQYFWCAMVGLPLLGFGSMLLKFGYMGAIGRYVAGEAAPVASDTINYLGEEAAPGIRSAVRSVAEGLADARGTRTAQATCPACEVEVDADARFCDQCGADLKSRRTCPACETENDLDARFCDACGHRFPPGHG